MRVTAVLLLCLAGPAGAGEPQATRVEQLADFMGLRALVERIEHARAPQTLEEKLDLLVLRDDAVAEVQRVALKIDATVSRLWQEQSACASAEEYVGGRHEAAVTTWNIAAVIVGNGFAIAGTSLQFDGTTQAYVGDGLIIVGAALATAFGVVALVRKDVGRPPFAIETNLLAQVLGRPPTDESRLPEPIWRYLDTPLVGESQSIRAALIEKWRREDHLGHDDSARAQRRLDHLTRPISRHEVVTADLLGDRAAMLADLRSKISALKLDLQEIIPAVRAPH
jgi:hypothetical protein